MKLVGTIFTVIALFSLMIPFSINDAMAQTPLYGAANLDVIDRPGGASSLYLIDQTNGNAVLIGPIGFDACSGMDFLLGIMYATCMRTDTTTIVLVTINLNNGAGTEVGPLNLSQLNLERNPDISFRNSDNILHAYFMNPGGSSQTLGTININTGAASSIGLTGVSGGGNGIAFSAGDTLFHGRTFNLDQTLNTMNQGTGASSTLFNVAWPGIGGLGRPNAMDIEPGTGVLFLSIGAGEGNPVNLASMNTGTGVITSIGQTQIGLDALAFAPAGIGGELLPINTTALLLAGLQSSALWMIPFVVSAIGIGAVLIRKKSSL